MAEQCQSAYRCEVTYCYGTDCLVTAYAGAATGRYHEPDESSSHFDKFLNNILILSSHLLLLILNYFLIIYLFTYFVHSLFNDVISSSDYAA
jgi:hypothetical protein